MKNLYSYTYCVLRYVHDTTSGEFVNVGIVLYAPEARYLSALCRNTYGRLNKVFPGVNSEHFKSLMRYIQARIEEQGERVAGELPLTDPSNVLEFAHAILPRDDSSLQWSPAGSGRTDDPSRTLERLFDRMVLRYEERQVAAVRSDEDVWRNFKRNLDERRLLQYFQPKKIAVQDDEIEFQYAWKNGVWNCLEPLSFDLAAADSIRDKAHRWLGQFASLQGATDHFKVYLLVGAPQQEGLQSAFLNAVSILKKIPADREIVFEQDAPALAARIAKEVSLHDTAHPGTN
ncbi:MAG: DUF3037 domain-containing protein [Betaproteobacteria bacterium]|nr:DUF3037 domain-containing protein [Betaproteobacteria bacterium]